MGARPGSRGPIHLAANVLLAATAIVVCGVGCGGSEGSADAGDTGTTTDVATTSTSATKGPECGKAHPSKARHVEYEAPTPTVKKGEKLTAVVDTSCGTFSIALDTKRFLTVANSFAFLARRGFYDGLPFDRAAVGTYLQGGNPPGPANGPGYAVTGNTPEGFIYRHGTVAMSQAPEVPPGHAGSQFFVVVAKPWLDFIGIYAPFGKVVSGFGALERITELGPPPAPGPKSLGSAGLIGKLHRPVTIEKISIEKAS